MIDKEYESFIHLHVEKSLLDLELHFSQIMFSICKEVEEDTNTVLNIFTNLVGNLVSQVIMDMSRGVTQSFTGRIKIRDNLLKNIVQITINSLNNNEAIFKDVKKKSA